MRQRDYPVVILALLLTTAVALPAAEHDPLRAELARTAAPWYDAEHDRWRRVEVEEKVREPRAPPSPWSIGLVDAVAWCLALAAACGLAWLLWSLRSRGASPAPSPSPVKLRSTDPAAVRHLALGEARDPEEALAAARAAEDWPRAMVWLYALLLVGLDRGGVLHLRPGVTNRRYRAEIRAWAETRPIPDLAPAAAEAIDGFERVFFGKQTVDRPVIDGLEQRIRRVLAAVGEHA